MNQIEEELVEKLEDVEDKCNEANIESKKDKTKNGKLKKCKP